MRKRTALIVAVAVVATLVLTGVALAKNYKFTFEDVTFSDGTEGAIEAASKLSQPNKDDPAEFTSCSYYTTDYETYLGQFTSDEFFSSDGDEVKQFCLDNYENRE